MRHPIIRNIYSSLFKKIVLDLKVPLWIESKVGPYACSSSSTVLPDSNTLIHPHTHTHTDTEFWPFLNLCSCKYIFSLISNWHGLNKKSRKPKYRSISTCSWIKLAEYWFICLNKILIKFVAKLLKYIILFENIFTFYNQIIEMIC